jgi:SAM-dependent methyltransferase
VRRANSYTTIPIGASQLVNVPASAEEFRQSMGYEQLGREQLLERTRVPWVAELHETLAKLLRKDRAILSLGSGQGEHEIAFFVKGYEITASDIVPDVLTDAQSAFPGFRARVLDALSPTCDELYDDVLATGIDYALDDNQLLELLLMTRCRLLRPGGRLILVLRFHDNLATRALDWVLVPMFGFLQALSHRVRKDGWVTVRRHHGYRRTRGEIRHLAAAGGYRVGRICHTCFALELARIPTPRIVMTLVRGLDRRLHMFNSATVFELLPVDCLPATLPRPNG